MKGEISIGDKYGPAMEMADQAEADRYFQECVAHTMAFGKTQEEAEKIERTNLGYYAGYYSAETRARVERLFRCAHPVFGAIAERGDLIQAGQQLLYWWETRHSCPCGARPESPDTHPHVPGCPTERAIIRQQEASE